MLMYKNDQVSDVHPSQIQTMKNRGWSDKAPAAPKTKVTKKEAS
jgi:hypothetical protein|tara:strand:+ start:180 stop:311 length:132 start_codon:yes stop_codon:yes gene_type:complete